MNSKKVLLLLIVLISFLQGITQNKKVLEPNIASFMDLRFGMFIHWGPVSLRGTEIGWSRGKEVSEEDYDNLYKEFNPVLFNADEWVKAAKDAGMKYLTITARHHDGFCLWPTRFTAYNIMNTPFKKDVVGALKKACDKQGIKFCIYYSILDWWHPEYPIHSAHNNTIDAKSDMNKYLIYMKNQLKELVTNYDPQMLWFDGGWEKPWTNEMGKGIYSYLKQLKPSLVINNRLGKEMAGLENKKIEAHTMVGDFDTPEQVVGRMNMETPWESCFTICNQWAWKPNDKMKSLDQNLGIISKTMGGNGNLLLNVGPMPDGRIEARQITRLKEIGDWLKVNGTAVYGTLGGPYHPTNDYAATRKGNKIFLHIINTKNTEIELQNIPNRKITKLHTMQGENLKLEEGNNTFKIYFPDNLIGKTEYVVVLEVNGDTETLPLLK